PVSACCRLETINRRIGFKIRKTSTAMNASSTSILASSRRNLETTPPKLTERSAIESSVTFLYPARLYTERVAPLLDDFGDTLGDLLDGWVNGLHVLRRFGVFRGLDLGPYRFIEVIHPDPGGALAQEELHEQARAIGVFAAFHDAGRRDDQHSAVCRVDHCKRIALLRTFKQCADGSGPGDLAFSRVQHRHCIIDRTPDPRIVFRKFFEELPTVVIAQRQRPSADIATERGMTERDIVVPFRIEQVGPVSRDVGFLDLCSVVSDADHAGGSHEIIAVRIVVLVDIEHLARVVWNVFFELVRGFQGDGMTDIGRAEDVALNGAGLDFLSDALVGDLSGGTQHVDLEAGIDRLEAAAKSLCRDIVRLGCIPGHFAAFFLRSLVELLLVRSHGRGGLCQSLSAGAQYKHR